MGKDFEHNNNMKNKRQKVETLNDQTTALCSEMFDVVLIVVMKVLPQVENYQMKNKQELE